MKWSLKYSLTFLLATLVCQCGMAFANVYQPDLTRFPAPFIDRVIIMLPKGFPGNSLNALYYLTNALYFKKPPHNINIASQTYDSKLMTNSNTVVIGTANDIVKMMSVEALPLKVNQAGMFLGEDGKPLSDQTGVIMSIAAPWNKELAVLIISGNSAASVATAAKALRGNHFKEFVHAQRQYALISEDKSQKVAAFADNVISFNNFFDNSHDVKLMLPIKHSKFSDQEIIHLIISMAYHASNINNIDIVDNADDISASDYFNIIYLGNIQNNSQLNALTDKVPFNLGEHQLIINRHLVKLVNMINELPIGIIELTRSPLYKNQVILLMISNSFNDYLKTIDTYFNADKRQYLRGDAALIYADDFFTSLDTARITNKAENKRLISSIHTTVINGFYLMIALFFLMLVALIIYQRAKKYFSRNSGGRDSS